MEEPPLPWRLQSSPNGLLEEWWGHGTAYDRISEELRWVERVSESTFSDLHNDSREALRTKKLDNVDELLVVGWHWEERQEIQRWALFLAAYSLFEADMIDTARGNRRAGVDEPSNAYIALKDRLRASIRRRISDWDALITRARELKDLRDLLSHHAGIVHAGRFDGARRQLEARGTITVEGGLALLTPEGARLAIEDLKQVARLAGCTPWSLSDRGQRVIP